MEFCEKCGAMMLQKDKNTSMCPRCNHSSKGKTNLKISEVTHDRDKNKEIAVVKKQSEVLPIVDFKCPKCNHEEAYFWTVQTRAADESETKFFKCVKCSHTKREYR